MLSLQEQLRLLRLRLGDARDGAALDANGGARDGFDLLLRLHAHVKPAPRDRPRASDHRSTMRLAARRVSCCSPLARGDCGAP